MTCILPDDLNLFDKPDGETLLVELLYNILLKSFHIATMTLQSPILNSYSTISLSTTTTASFLVHLQMSYF